MKPGNTIQFIHFLKEYTTYCNNSWFVSDIIEEIEELQKRNLTILIRRIKGVINNVQMLLKMDWWKYQEGWKENLN